MRGSVGFRGGFGNSRIVVRGFGGRGFAGPHFGLRRSHRFLAYPGVYAYPYSYPLYDLGFGYSSTDSYDQSAYEDSQYKQQLSRQIYDLDSRVRDLRDQNDQLQYELEKRSYDAVRPPAYVRPQPEAAPRALPQPVVPQSMQSEPQGPATVFVFKSGVTVDTRNYAIVGQTLWILSPQRALKYPLAQLDYDATHKANADRGLDVALPTPVSTPAKPLANSPTTNQGD